MSLRPRRKCERKRRKESRAAKSGTIGLGMCCGGSSWELHCSTNSGRVDDSLGWQRPCGESRTLIKAAKVCSLVMMIAGWFTAEMLFAHRPSSRKQSRVKKTKLFFRVCIGMPALWCGENPPACRQMWSVSENARGKYLPFSAERAPSVGSERLQGRDCFRLAITVRARYFCLCPLMAC